MNWNLEDIFKNKEEFENTKKELLENLDKIESVDFKNSIIYLNNDTSLDYLSRNYKKGLREIL